MTIAFSTQPGCRERQLQLRRDNPLFPPQLRRVTAEDIRTAQQQDRDEHTHLREQFTTLLNEAAALPAEADSELILNLKARIDPLYDQCASFGPAFDKLRGALDQLYQVIAMAIRKAAGADPLAQRELDEEDAARQTHTALLCYPLVATLLRPEDIIGEEELVPTLLSQDEDALRAALQLFDAEQLEVLCRSGRTLVSRLREDGIRLDDAEARLVLMEQRLKTLKGNSH